MEQDFQYDVFLSHSAKDKAVVRPLAERLRLTLSQLSTLNPQPSTNLRPAEQGAPLHSPAAPANSAVHTNFAPPPIDEQGLN